MFKFRGGQVCRGEIVKDGRVDIPEGKKDIAEIAFQELKDVEETYRLTRKVGLKEDGITLNPAEVRLVGDILDLDLGEDAK